MRFGLLGTGPWAALTQAPGLAAHPDAEFAGIWGRNPDKAAALGRRHDVPAFSDLDALLDAVDAVAVALPPEVQAELATRAARAGKHLLLDKPIALTSGAADELAGEVTARGLASVVFFTNRFMPEIEAALGEAAAVGGWQEARVEHVSSIFEPGNPFGASPWRREHGGLWDVGPHALSMVLPVLGPVAAVTAMSGPGNSTHVLLRHTAGQVTHLALSVDAAPAAQRSSAVLFGEAGERELPARSDAVVEAFGAAIDQLIAAAGGGAQPACDVRFGAEVTKILQAAEASARGGRTLEV
ncbi:Gfo/Idh/MocA family protein [Spirilliplanes yamanashiensis]|uniref:Oxidoreductase n=1 Tax=Spirilliplanes yamanashiensis TaxID=42233 RepID=A0A8J4DGY0_9ACTN|nr:Gfo/Idh/MocA family oxidoreductase [Spirilliplanes yamanashiensis]MDP9820026.1 putative dehydrogenase [Spirilliplanes yamanashiensis]GIJ01154.1 oxidoreductase [Spirilliplanes yamanashiensis]